MNSLKKILGNFADSSVFGSDTAELTNEQLTAIESHLKKLKNRDKYILIGCVTAMVLLLVLILLLTGESKKLEMLIGKSSIIGISIAGIATYSYKVWKEVNYIDLLLIFIRTIDRPALQAIINETWKRI